VHDPQLDSGRARNSGSAAHRRQDSQRLGSLRLQRECEESLNVKKRKLSSLEVKHISQKEAKAIASVAEDSVDMGEMLLKPCAGARNMLKHLTQDAAAPVSADLTSGTSGRQRKTDSGNPAALLRAERQERTLPAPRLARHVSSGGEVCLDVTPAQRQQAATKAKAIALLRQKGGARKTDPNAVRATPSSQRREKVLKRVPEPRTDENTPESGSTPAAPAEKRPRLDVARVRAAISARSSHAAALEVELDESQEHYFTALERKELLENKMLTTWELKTKAVYCPKCKYRALSASDLCKTERHPTVLVDALKRFFSCKGCKNRTMSLDKLPRLPCKNCGAENWQKAPMGKERTGPKLDSEILSIRGNEADRMNSYVRDHNINLEF